MQTLLYQFNFKRYREHLIDVTLTFTAHENNPVVWLPVWIAGSYLIREFSRHITAVTMIQNGLSQRCQKLDKNHWQVIANQGDVVTLSYEVYAYDLSVRGAYVDNHRLYGNFAVLALAVKGQEQQAINAKLICPMEFSNEQEQRAIRIGAVSHKYSGNISPYIQLATALDSSAETQQNPDNFIFTVSANNYEHFIDNPFEIAAQNDIWISIVTPSNLLIFHRFFISGIHDANLKRLEQDLTKICETYIKWLYSTPFLHYVFMITVTDNDYGGLEHLSSTSLIVSRDDLPSFDEAPEPSDNYRRFLGLCSHEYFHAWWVKTVRPDVMMNPDLNRENYTSLLWVFEGFTSYIDEFILQASGVINKNSYLKSLSNEINRYLQTHGRNLQSVAEASFDAWIKLYRHDENTANAGVSYYNKGALVALCLDLILMNYSENRTRLFDVVKIFYQKAKAEADCKIGMTDKLLDEVMSELLPPNIWLYFRQNFIEGTTILPLEELLQQHGVHIRKDHDNSLHWGLKTTPDVLGLKVQRVIRNSQASDAGISANDIIIAIDGLKANEKLLKATAKKQSALGRKSVSCHIFRRDELMLVEIPPQNKHHEPQPEKWLLYIDDFTKASQWLHLQKEEGYEIFRL